MGIAESLFGQFTGRGKATTLYKRGMQKAEERDLKGAIEDYTAVVEMKKAPPDVVGMALVNRALAYSRIQDDESAEADLNMVLSMPDVPAKIKGAASEKLHRMKRRTPPPSE